MFLKPVQVVDFMQTLVNFKFKLDPELQAIFSSNPQFRAVLKDLEEYSKLQSLQNVYSKQF